MNTWHVGWMLPSAATSATKHCWFYISAVYAESREPHGWPRIWRELVKRGIRKVASSGSNWLMQTHGIRARQAALPRNDHRQSSASICRLRLMCLTRKFTVAAPNQAWVGDLTYIATEEGWLFLVVVIDLFSRQVVGWSMRPDMQRNLVIDVLWRWPGSSAIQKRRLS